MLVHLLREVRPDIPVLFLDTFHHFRQTLAYRDALAERWNLNLVNLRAAEPQVGLWQQDTKPAARGTRWARSSPRSRTTTSGSRDCGATSRRRAPTCARSSRSRCRAARCLRKVSPLVDWTMKDVWQHAKAHDIPLLPLYELGYTSIGCEPCTSLPLDPSNPRSGRWQGQKLECGIHDMYVESAMFRANCCCRVEAVCRCACSRPAMAGQKHF